MNRLRCPGRKTHVHTQKKKRNRRELYTLRGVSTINRQMLAHVLPHLGSSCLAWMDRLSACFISTLLLLLRVDAAVVCTRSIYWFDFGLSSRHTGKSLSTACLYSAHCSSFGPIVPARCYRFFSSIQSTKLNQSSSLPPLQLGSVKFN